MNINRNNYEEFFLLYVDNELSAADRSAVENFVQQNPDLKKELILFQQATLLDEEESFTINKKALYKNEQSIGQSNYEEYFLLHVDNELSAEEKDEVEKFVLQHPELQNEFTLLHSTKLPPEVVEFKDKASLYRKEKSTPIIPITWMRMAAAAAVIIAIATVWLTGGDKEIITQVPIAVVKETKSAGGIGKKPYIEEKDVKQADKASSSLVSEVDKRNAGAEKTQALVVRKTQQPTATEHQIEVAQQDKKTIQPVNNENLNNLPTPEENPVFAQRNNPVIDRNTRAAEPVNEKSVTNLQATLASNTGKDVESRQLIKQTVYKELDTEQDEEAQTLYIGGAEINKNKLRGLFKKAATLINKRVNKAGVEKSVQ